MELGPPLLVVELAPRVVLVLPLLDLLLGQQVVHDLTHQAVAVAEDARAKRPRLPVHDPVAQPVKRRRLPAKKTRRDLIENTRLLQSTYPTVLSNSPQNCDADWHCLNAAD